MHRHLGDFVDGGVGIDNGVSSVSDACQANRLVDSDNCSNIAGILRYHLIIVALLS